MISRASTAYIRYIGRSVVNYIEFNRSPNLRIVIHCVASTLVKNTVVYNYC